MSPLPLAGEGRVRAIGVKRFARTLSDVEPRLPSPQPSPASGRGERSVPHCAGAAWQFARERLLFGDRAVELAGRVAWLRMSRRAQATRSSQQAQPPAASVSPEGESGRRLPHRVEKTPEKSMSDVAVPQLSVRAIVLSVILAVILAAANAYLGLFAGLTIATAIPAAVVSMARAAPARRRHDPREQHRADRRVGRLVDRGGRDLHDSRAVILGYWQDFRYSWVLAIAGLGGMLGVLFSVPLRRSMIVEQNARVSRRQGRGRSAARPARIPGPASRSSRWPARSARSSSSPRKAACALIPDNAVGARFHRQGHRVHGHQSVAGAARRRLHRRAQRRHRRRVAAASSRATSRFRSTTRSSSTAIPALAARVAGMEPRTIAGAIWSAKIRYLGVGAMLIGGVWTLFSLRKSLLSGIRSGLAARAQGHRARRRRNRARPADEVDADRAGACS